MRRLLSVFCLALAATASADEKTDAVKTLIPWLLDEKDTLREIRFADVIAATSGKKVIAIDPKNQDDQRVLAELGTALDAVLAAMNAPDSPTRAARRVNEMSAKFEDAILAQLKAAPGLECSIPPTAAGLRQRSGYPDLRVLDKATGRVFYLDPKLFARGSKTSALRTFYFEPKRATNKVNDDARHLIIGIEHDHDADGVVQFQRWELLDLANFRVKLKAEFEGSNADMYRPEAVVGAGPKR
ncbi:MAG: hypothetical protein K8R23_20520 [Chthoniobacter sp.]|nr:hypothetical protein [Chthoniobacter sp.]